MERAQSRQLCMTIPKSSKKSISTKILVEIFKKTSYSLFSFKFSLFQATDETKAEEWMQSLQMAISLAKREATSVLGS